jgi:hypothetical protein
VPCGGAVGYQPQLDVLVLHEQQLEVEQLEQLEQEQLELQIESTSVPPSTSSSISNVSVSSWRSSS